MRLSDSHILIRIAEGGSYQVSVTYGVLNGAEIETRQWEHRYVFEHRSNDVLSELANILANVSHDISH